MATPRARRHPFLPVIGLILVLAALDQALLHSGALRVGVEHLGAWAQAWQAPFRRYEELAPDRPAFGLIGSSRAEAIETPHLQAALAGAGLPHQAFNFGSPVGTPALMWLGLDHVSAATAKWPPGSRLVYLFSPMELGTLQVVKMATLAAGRDELVRHLGPDAVDKAVDIPVDEITSPTLRALYPHSGFAQALAKANRLFPPWLVEVRRRLYAPAVNFTRAWTPPARNAAECDKGITPLPANLEAFERIARRFGPDLTVVFAPMAPEFEACDALARRQALAALAPLAHSFGFRLVEPAASGFDLPPETWTDDATHVVTPDGRSRVARRLVELAR